MRTIKYLVMDVDGTLTDGKIYMGQDGEIAKAFDIKDGCGILLELPQYGIIPVIITARKSRILEQRCKELSIQELHQGVKNKLTKLKEIVGEDLGVVAYAGDDLPDVPCMEAVKKAGGLVVCPFDAIPEIRAMADYVSGNKAGYGAIRDIIHYIGNTESAKEVYTKIENTIAWIQSTDFSEISEGSYRTDDGMLYSIQEYATKDESQCILESHRNHIDIQYMIAGTEVFKSYSTNCLTCSEPYDAVKDIEYWENGMVTTQTILVPGSLIVVMNGQPHKGAIQNSQPQKVKKLVCKIVV